MFLAIFAVPLHWFWKELIALQMLQYFVLYCREFLEQRGEFCPVCIYMRDEVRQQNLLTVSSSAPKV